MMKIIVFTSLVVLVANINATVEYWDPPSTKSTTSTSSPRPTTSRQTTPPTTVTETTSRKPTTASTKGTTEITTPNTTTKPSTTTSKSTTNEPHTTTTKKPTTTTEAPDDDFSDICGDTGIFVAPHPRDCHLFIFCNYGTWQIRKCFFNFYFSARLHMCVFPAFSECKME